MQCIKTGAHCRLAEYGKWALGDAYEIGGTGVVVLRIVAQGHTPYRSVKHFTIDAIDHWFDEWETSQQRPSILVTKPKRWRMHSYEGVPI